MGEHGGDHAGELVRTFRRKAGLTQRQLAEAAGVGVGVVRDLEQGRTERPHGESVRRLASALRLSQQQVMEFGLAVLGNGDTPEGAGPRDRTGAVRIGVLGPLTASRQGVPLPLGPPLQRAVLGLLVLYEDAGLSRDAMIDALWGEAPPPTAVSMMQSYVSRLRRVLGPGCPVGKTSSGYRLEPTTCDLDLTAFEALVSQARQAHAAGDFERACQAYADALALWRGEPLADCDSLRGHPAVARMIRQNSEAVTGYAEAAIAASRPERALPRLRALADREPLNERAHALLMIALAGSGQQAAALGVFDLMRRRLDRELGLRPGAELTAAQTQILNQQIPAAIAASPSDDAPGRPIPSQLPSGVTHFAGRAAELAVLNVTFDQAAGRTIVISAIAGTAGVGKTALAVEWAHQVSERFPDGQLYVNLRGYDPDQPVPATDALARFLRALGVRGQEIPPEEDERAGRYRSLLAGKRMLVVLDNAGSAEQVRPLLPGTPTCTVVVTSRDALAGLVARDGATRLDLDLLPAADAVGLLRALIGSRVDADPEAAVQLADQCCRLPLALRVAAEYATSRPGVPLAELTGELTDLQRRLDLLAAGGDRRAAVRTVFSWSYQHLDAGAARTFRLLGVHPGPDFEPYAVAALAGVTAKRASELLGVLARAHLIHVTSPGRYGLHDLLRAYARELAGDPAEQEAALTRLFDHYLGTAAVAMDALYPAERGRRPRIPTPATEVPPVATPAGAQEWLDAQRAVLVTVAVQVADDGQPGYVAKLADTLFRYLDGGSHYPEALLVHSRARIAAQRAGDGAAEAVALKVLGLTTSHQGHYQQATGYLEQALALFRRLGDRTGQAQSLTNLGVVSFLQGRYEHAGDWWQQALAVHREKGDQVGETAALGNLGLLDLRQGRYQRASGRLGQSLALARKTGNRATEVTALVNLGEVSLRQGAYAEATARLQEALALSRQISDRNHEASALARLGEVCLRLGRLGDAAEHLQRALALAQQTGDREDEAEALNGLGEVLLGSGRPGPALDWHAAALALALQIGGKNQQARAHRGIARAHQASGAPDLARDHRREALGLYADLGAPEADVVRAESIEAGDADLS
jgi:DNA-binding SARP family transcriptional activator/Flp pilus assembly protein TadD/DNA-binding XRE family transcriptional regulator